MTTFYIASRLENATMVKFIAEELRMRGLVGPTYDWTRHGSVQAAGPKRMQEVAAAELDGLRNADIVIVLLPGGRGTHVELGVALALEKRVFIWLGLGGVSNDCAFYYAKHVQISTALIAELAQQIVDWLQP